MRASLSSRLTDVVELEQGGSPRGRVGLRGMLAMARDPPPGGADPAGETRASRFAANWRARRTAAAAESAAQGQAQGGGRLNGMRMRTMRGDGQPQPSYSADGSAHSLVCC